MPEKRQCGLGYLALATLCAVLLSIMTLGHVEAATARPKMCVVGAGIAGIIAANDLAKLNRYDVVLLEASNHLAGRVRSVRTISNVSLDLGAQWIHGPTGHPFMAWARRLRKRTILDDHPVLYIKADGQPFPPREINALNRDLTKILNRITALQERGERDRPFSGAALQAWNQVAPTLTSVLRNPSSPEAQDRFRWLMNLEIRDDEATELENLSHWYWDEDDYLYGGDRLVPMGLGALFMAANPVAPSIDLRFNVRVNSVNTQQSDRVILRTTTGATYTCDGAIITVSLGVLQSGFISFNPALPQATQRAIRNRGLGHAEKFLLEFSTRWWPPQGDFYQADNSNAFNAIEDMTRIVGKPTLCIIIAGEINVARYLQKSDAQVLEDILDTLVTMFPGRTIPRPIWYTAARWVKDPLYYGAWSYNRVGINPAADFAAIKRSGSPRLVFAGEHTDRGKPGTVWGAYNSGKLSARTLAQAVGPVAG